MGVVWRLMARMLRFIRLLVFNRNNVGDFSYPATELIYPFFATECTLSSQPPHPFNPIQAPQEIKNVVAFLRGKNGPKIRRGVLNGKRVDYFRGW